MKTGGVYLLYKKGGVYLVNFILALGIPGVFLTILYVALNIGILYWARKDQLKRKEAKRSTMRQARKILPLMNRAEKFRADIHPV